MWFVLAESMAAIAVSSRFGLSRGIQLDETIYSICTFLARGCFDAGSDLCLDCVAWESVDGLPV